MLANTAGTANPAPQDLPLPLGWEKDVSADGRVFYLDHNNMKTYWTHPLERDADLPAGWESVTNEYGHYYMNHETGQATYDHPGQAAQSGTTKSDEDLRPRLDTADTRTQAVNGKQVPLWLFKYAEDPLGAAGVDWGKFAVEDVTRYVMQLDSVFDEEIKQAQAIADESIRAVSLSHCEYRRSLAEQDIGACISKKQSG